MISKQPPRLSDFTPGRDNNFNLLRMIAALAVLVSHCYPLSLGAGAGEPLAKLLGMSLGTPAVDVFFIISGFLVTGSLLKRKHVADFLWARVLRVYPALLVVVVLTVFVLGPCFTKLPLVEYFSHPSAYSYLLKCTTLVDGVVYLLPGVFQANPFGPPVNGSLWTLPYEVRMYGILLLAWLLLRLAGPHRQRILQVAVVSAVLITLGLIYFGGFYRHGQNPFVRFFYLFFYGSAFYVLRGRIRLSGVVFGLILVCLAAARWVNVALFFKVYLASIAYVVLYLAYVPAGFLRQYNKLGDYSYGVYIYAFVVQQSIAALIPGVSPRTMLLLATPITLFLAVLSWKLVERHALKLKEAYAARTRRLLGMIRRRPA